MHITLNFFEIKHEKMLKISAFRSSPPEVFLAKDVLEISSKFTGEHSCGRVILIKLLCNFTEIALWHRCCLANLLHIFRTPFCKNTYGGLLLQHYWVLIFEKAVYKEQIKCLEHEFVNQDTILKYIGNKILCVMKSTRTN